MTHMCLDKEVQTCASYMQVYQQWTRSMLVSAREEASDPSHMGLPLSFRPHELTIRPAGSPLITGTDAVQLPLQ